MAPPRQSDLTPFLKDLADAGEHIAIRLAAIEDALRSVIANTTPIEERYNNSQSNALENARVVKSGAGRLFGFSGFNSKASTQWILGFDATAIPANGAVPAFVMQAPASDNFWASWTPNWRNFREGWILCNSTTAATLTIGVADCWFDAQYL